MFGATASADVHAHHVPPLGPGAVGGSDHILRVTGAFQSVYDYQGQSLLPLRLPVAVAQNLYVLLDLEESILRRWKAIHPLQEVSGNGLGMASAQEAARHKIICYRREVRRMGDEFRTGHGSSGRQAPV